MGENLKNKRNEKGITLVALVITIVVLLILAGVSIITLFDENGIINSAKKAKEETEQGVESDIKELNELTKELNKYSNGSSGNININDYATLNFQTFMGKFVRQKANYLKMRVEISDKTNSTDKIIFNIGTDWKDNIKKENDSQSQLFIADSTDLKMIQVLGNDAGYSVGTDETKTIRRDMLAAFTDIKISDLKVKKGKEYTIKVFIQSASIKNGVAVANDVEVHTLDTGIINDSTKNINVSKTEMIKESTTTYFKIFDANGDEHGNGSDASYYNGVAAGIYGLKQYCYTINASGTHNKFTALQLFNEVGDPIDETYVGFDLNRDGYVNGDDADIISKLGVGAGY